MRNATPLLTAALVGLLCMTPLAMAQDVLGHGALESDHARGAADVSAHEKTYDAAADAVTDEATAAADAHAEHSDVVEGEGLWAWLSVHFSAIVGRLGEMLGVGATTDGSADLVLDETGAKVDVNVGPVTLGHTVDAPELGARLDQVRGEAGTARETVDGLVQVPSLG